MAEPSGIISPVPKRLSRPPRKTPKSNKFSGKNHKKQQCLLTRDGFQGTVFTGKAPFQEALAAVMARAAQEIEKIQ
jgi:hypothetical protein